MYGCSKYDEYAVDGGLRQNLRFEHPFVANVTCGNQTWQWTIPLNGDFIGKSPINGQFSSTPCLITGG